MTMRREPFLTNSRIKPTPLKPRQTPLKRSTKPIRSRRPGRSADKRPGMSPKHLAMIRQLPCCITGKRPVDAHHLKEGLAHERGVGRKATDRWAVPLCREKHEEVERVGSRNEWAWFKKHGIEDPLELAAALWRVSGDLDRMRRVLEAHRGAA